MATKSGGAVNGTKKLSGERQSIPAPAGVTADLSVSYDDTRITNKADFMAACQAIANQHFAS